MIDNKSCASCDYYDSEVRSDQCIDSCERSKWEAYVQHEQRERERINKMTVAITDEINHPSHYTQGGIECIDAIEAALTPEELRGYLKGNCLKYIWRERGKGGNKDIEKAEWYIRRLLGDV